MSEPTNGNSEKLIDEFNQKMDERIEQRDALKLDPTERAQFVHELIFWALDLEDDADSAIGGYILWDVLCYCVHLINQYAIALGDDDFMLMARAINTWLFTMHYNMDESEIQLGPQRDKHIEFWTNQLYEPKEVEKEEMS
jgi:hypothetical protein